MNILENKKIWLGLTKINLFLLLIFPLTRWTTSNWYLYTIFQRTIYIQILIAIALLSYSILIIRFKQYRPKSNILLWSFIAFIVANVIATVFSVNINNSFWGHFRRMTGLLQLIHYFFLFLISFNVFKEKKDWNIVFYGYTTVTLILGVSALFMDNFLDGVRLFGLNSNPIFLAMSVFFGLFILMYLYFQQKNNIIKYFYIAPNIIFHLIIIVLTGSRGYFIATGIGLLVFTFGLINIKINKKSIKYPILAVIVIIFTLLSVNFFLPTENKTYTKYLPGAISRYADMSIYTESFLTRYNLWKFGLKGWYEHNLWVGAGPENYYYLLDNSMDAEFIKYGTGETYADKAHNAFIDIGATSGIIGLLCFLAIIISGFSILIKNYKLKKISNYTLISFLSLFIAYVISAVNIFDQIYTYIPLILILSFLTAIYTEEKEIKITNKISNILSVIFILISLISLFYFTAKPFANFLKFARADSKGTPETINLALSQDSFQVKPFFLERFTRRFLNLHPEYQKQTIDNLINENKKEIMYSRRISGYHSIAYLYIIKAGLIPEQAEDSLKQAEEYTKKMIEINPKRYQSYLGLASAYLDMGEYQKAINTSLQAIEIYSDQHIPYWILAKSYFGLQDYNTAAEWLRKGIQHNLYGFYLNKNDDFIIDVIKIFALASQNHENYLRTQDTVAMIVKNEPEKIDYLVFLAKEFYNSDYKENGLSLAKIIAKQAPDKQNELADILEQAQ